MLIINLLVAVTAVVAIGITVWQFLSRNRAWIGVSGVELVQIGAGLRFVIRVRNWGEAPAQGLSLTVVYIGPWKGNGLVVPVAGKPVTIESSVFQGEEVDVPVNAAVEIDWLQDRPYMCYFGLTYQSPGIWKWRRHHLENQSFLKRDGTWRKSAIASVEEGAQILKESPKEEA